MRLLVDTNVWLDVALNRPAAVDSAAFLRHCALRNDSLWLAWHTVANLDYILKRAKMTEENREQHLRSILTQARIAATDETDALHALSLRWKDFEDALQAAAAQCCHAALIITGNTANFSTSPIPAISPAEFIRGHPLPPHSSPPC